MSNDTEIDTVVSTFVADLEDLVRRAALSAVRSALGAIPVPAPKRPRPAARPAAPKPPSVQKPVTPPAREANLLGFLPVLGKREEPQPKLAAPLPVPRRFPPKRTRTRNPKPAAPPPQPVVEAAPPGESPARKWVVVRRPARDRTEGAVSDRPPPPVTEAAPPEAPGDSASHRPASAAADPQSVPSPVEAAPAADEAG